ncbi:MAG: MFS transporter [Ignavibacteriae bacterium]|nr:MAG: MFS transporter [Ignavibacteriota bacterium]
MLQKIKEYLGLQKNTAALLLMVILVGIGERIAERFLPLYLLALGGGIVSIGIFSGANNLTNALYSFFGGYLSDRFGYKRALFLFNAMTIAGYLIVIVFPYWQAVIIGSFFFLSWTAISMPATLELVTRSVPATKHAMGVSLNSLTRRVPMILGPLIGGMLVELYGETEGIRDAFIIAAGLAVLSTIFQQWLISSPASIVKKTDSNPIVLWKEMSRGLKQLLLSDILIRFCEQIPYAFVVLWCIKEVGVTPVQFAELTTVEMLTALLIYVPVAHFADQSAKKPFIVTTFIFFTLFPVLLFFSKSFHLLIVAFVLRGLKEFGEPTRKALIMELCPEQKKAGMFGFYYLLRDAVVTVAAVTGAWLWSISPLTNLLSAFVFGLAGTVWFILNGEEPVMS